MYVCVSTNQDLLDTRCFLVVLAGARSRGLLREWLRGSLEKLEEKEEFFGCPLLWHSVSSFLFFPLPFPLLFQSLQRSNRNHSLGAASNRASFADCNSAREWQLDKSEFAPSGGQPKGHQWRHHQTKLEAEAEAEAEARLRLSRELQVWGRKWLRASSAFARPDGLVENSATNRALREMLFRATSQIWPS